MPSLLDGLPPRDHWTVIRRGPTGADPQVIDIVGVFADQGAAAAEAARLDALAGAGGPRHWVQILVYLQVTETRELP